MWVGGESVNYVCLGVGVGGGGGYFVVFVWEESLWLILGCFVDVKCVCG